MDLRNKLYEMLLDKVILCHWQKLNVWFKSKIDTKADSIEDSRKRVEKPANPVVVLCLFSFHQACLMKPWSGSISESFPLW